MLTDGEKALLRPIFGTTLPYDDQYIATNDEKYGGENNSITLAIVPHMAVNKWALDYSSSSNLNTWTFIHEMTHVWYWYHGGSNMRSGIWTWVTHSNYGDAYFYDLSESASLKDYNFEAQCSIVADYWYVSRGLSPRHNNGRNRTLAAYQPFIMQVQGSGAPAPQGNKDFAEHWGSTSKYRPL